MPSQCGGQQAVPASPPDSEIFLYALVLFSSPCPWVESKREFESLQKSLDSMDFGYPGDGLRPPGCLFGIGSGPILFASPETLP